MAVTVTNSFTNTDAWDANKVNTNFNDILTWANGGITTAHISGSAGITNAQLANDDFVFAVPIVVTPDCWTATTSVGASEIVGGSGIPYNATDTFTVIGYSWYCTDVGSGDGTFSIEWGTVSSGSVTSVTQVLTTTTMAGTANSVGAGQGTLNIDIATASGTTRILYVAKRAHGTNVMNNATYYNQMTVTLLVKRKAGLGSF